MNYYARISNEIVNEVETVLEYNKTIAIYLCIQISKNAILISKIDIIYIRKTTRNIWNLSTKSKHVYLNYNVQM